MSGMGSSLVAQPFVSGPNVVIHGARSKDGAWDHHEAFITEIKSEGLAVSIRPHPLNANILSSCQRLESLLNIRGVFHFDFVVDQYSGETFYLEVNPRLGGTTAKVYAAGYDEPALLISTFTDKSQPETLLHTKRSPATSRIAATRCALATLSQPSTLLDFPMTSRTAIASRALKAILTYPDEVFSISDLIGNFAYLAQAGQ
jgi:biotin carboxylase